MFLARLPLTVTSLMLTLHVVGPLDRTYGEAGLVGTAMTAGTAVGAPMVGRMIDRHGLRRVVALCGTLTTAFWLGVAHLPYLPLVLLAFPMGMLTVPMSSLARQFLTALVPEKQRRTVFSLDTVLAGVSFLIGPTLTVAAATRYSTDAVLTAIGVWLALASVALWATDLPVRSADESRETGAGPRPRLRTLLDGRMTGSLVISFSAMVTLTGTQLCVVATLRAGGETAWTGVVLAIMALGSIIGGIPHGAMRRSLSQGVLGLLLGLLVVPVGVGGGSWWLLSLALVPMALVTAPALAANSETVSRLAPSGSRGVAMGLLDSSTRTGTALGGPAVGFVIDHTSPAWGFAFTGLAGLAFAGLGVLCHRSSRVPTRPPREPTSPADHAA
ncbi:MFS transporter [Streptomyces sp. S.PNR 29]|uniref:MFS transporter n=1 Tax=Streptomyces sp. S.PNR 29 TaxID=2973805 RepID=UPI0025B25920|nr:MFS transporter [Streptomyces sp. S.PNR 29]MDN0201106.1 MFS transporter [Streptomyces sp. S.PNR 29]